MKQQTKTQSWIGFEPKLFSKSSLLDKELCLEIRQYAEQSGQFRRHNIQGDVLNARYETMVIDMALDLNIKLHQALSPIWDEAAEFYNFNIEYCEPYEVKKYTEYDFMSDHEDQFYGSGKTQERKLTMIAQLSDNNDYTNGNFKMLRRYNSDRNIGSVFVFPSFYLHEVTRISSGTRYSLNSWAWGSLWK